MELTVLERDNIGGHSSYQKPKTPSFSYGDEKVV